ncbi:MAG: site-specific DNA-methyltransferase [Burkholderiaceae bacterium]|nr:MAG: site-specific DNA-methyltransferase [Burkholderiaceae bacterium]
MPTLDWLHREAAFQTAARVPTRVLRPHAAGHVFGDPAHAGNLLIQGDNLEALKALLPFYRGRVKCIFIDPPYNTKSAFEHYDDNLEHSQWLSMMLPRLQLLRELLSEDGSIWVTIDDHEGHYLKVLMDEVFGRGNFVANVVWRSSDNSNNDAKTFSVDHNHMLVFSRTSGWLTNKLDASEKRSHFKNPDNDPRGHGLTVNPLNSPKPRENLKYDLIAPNGNRIHHPANGWRWERETMYAKLASGEIRFNEQMTGIRRRTYLEDMKPLPPSTLWIDLTRTGHNRQAKVEQKALADGEPFGTPKPERLIAEIIHIATNSGDLVLDSFLGSGTTAAVAHKMGRRWIGIEMGEHAVTHCLPRLQKVVDGEQGGISTAVGWQGGGGFQMLQLGAPLFDAQGDIHPEVRFADLAAFIWMRETGTALPLEAAPNAARLPLLGVHEGTAYYLLFNGILGDRRPAGGNVLTTAVLQALNALCGHEGPKVVYGEACRLGDARLAAEGIRFKQLPHAVPR